MAYRNVQNTRSQADFVREKLSSAPIVCFQATGAFLVLPNRPSFEGLSQELELLHTELVIEFAAFPGIGSGLVHAVEDDF